MRSRLYFQSVAISASLIILTFLTKGFHYLVIDDWQLRILISGEPYFQPSEMIFPSFAFIHPVLWFFLNKLQITFKSIYVFDLFYLLAIFVNLTLIIFSIQSKFKSKVITLTFSTFISLISIRFISDFNFTQIAILFAMNSAIFFKRTNYILAIVLLACSTLFRPTATLLFSPLILLTIIFNLKNMNFKQVLSQLLFVIIFLATTLKLTTFKYDIDLNVFKPMGNISQFWKKVSESGDTGKSYSSLTRDEANKVININRIYETELIRNEVVTNIDKESLKFINDLSLIFSKRGGLARLFKTFQNIEIMPLVKNLKLAHTFLLYIFSFFIILLLYISNKKLPYQLLALSMTFILFKIFVIIYFKFLPWRLAYPLNIAYMGLFLNLCPKDLSQNFSKKIQIIFVSLTFLISLRVGISLFNKTVDNCSEEYISSVQSDLSTLMKENKTIFVHPEFGIGSMWWTVFKPFQTLNQRKDNFLFINWSHITKYQYKTLTLKKMTYNLRDNLLKKGVYLLASKEIAVTFHRYINKHEVVNLEEHKYKYFNLYSFHKSDSLKKEYYDNNFLENNDFGKFIMKYDLH